MGTYCLSCCKSHVPQVVNFWNWKGHHPIVFNNGNQSNWTASKSQGLNKQRSSNVQASNPFSISWLISQTTRKGPLPSVWLKACNTESTSSGLMNSWAVWKMTSMLKSHRVWLPTVLVSNGNKNIHASGGSVKTWTTPGRKSTNDGASISTNSTPPDAERSPNWTSSARTDASIGASSVISFQARANMIHMIKAKMFWNPTKVLKVHPWQHFPQQSDHIRILWQASLSLTLTEFTTSRQNLSQSLHVS